MGAAGELTEPTIAFRVHERDEPGLEIRVNFGMFAGRNATQAEIDDLARSLNDVVESFTVVPTGSELDRVDWDAEIASLLA